MGRQLKSAITWPSYVLWCGFLAGSTQLVELRRFSILLAPNDAKSVNNQIFEFSTFGQGGWAGLQGTGYIPVGADPFGVWFLNIFRRPRNARNETPTLIGHNVAVLCPLVLIPCGIDAARQASSI